LGSAVLVYAFLTSGALLSVAQGWAGAVNGALWVVYVLGGFGLIRGKGWARALTLLAAGGSLIALVVLLIVGGDLELVYFSTVWSLFGLPALAILVSALLVKLPPSKEVEVPPPTGTARKPRISRRALHDIAYTSFVVLGLIAIWTSYWAYVDPDPGVIGFLVIIPFGIPLLLALILGPGLSIVLWHDLRLMTLTALSIAMLIALEFLRVKDLPIPLSLYAAVCMTISLVWFVKYRRRFG
jgi:hypothetical protein